MKEEIVLGLEKLSEHVFFIKILGEQAPINYLKQIASATESFLTQNPNLEIASTEVLSRVAIPNKISGQTFGVLIFAREKH